MPIQSITRDDSELLCYAIKFLRDLWYNKMTRMTRAFFFSPLWFAPLIPPQTSWMLALTMDPTTQGDHLKGSMTWISPTLPMNKRWWFPLLALQFSCFMYFKKSFFQEYLNRKSPSARIPLWVYIAQPCSLKTEFLLFSSLLIFQSCSSSVVLQMKLQDLAYSKVKQ